MKKYALLLFVILVVGIKAMAQNPNNIDLNKSLLCANEWVIDEFYIDSIPNNDADIKSSIVRFYSSGDFSRGKTDFLFQGMYWNLSTNTQLSITYPAKNYVENLEIVVLMSDVLVTHQAIIGIGDNQPHLIECRYKPYINPTSN